MAAVPPTSGEKPSQGDPLEIALPRLPHPPEWVSDWERSSISRSQLEQLVTMGHLSEFTEMGWMAPHSRHKIPQPLCWNQVVHVAFIHRELRFPPSPFTRDVLPTYGLQLHHLTPSGVLHLSCFMSLFQSFLGVRPHFSLFWYFFEVVPHLKDRRIPSCGGAILQPHPGSSYFDLVLAPKTESWKHGWFYAPDNFHDPSNPGLSEFDDVPCWQRPEWRSRVDLDPGTSHLVDAVIRLQGHGLTSLQILKTWV